MLNVVLIAHLTYKNQWGEWHTKKTEFIRNDFDSLSIVALLEQKKSQPRPWYFYSCLQVTSSKKSKLLLMNSVSCFFWDTRPVVEWQNARVRCLRQWVCHQSDSRFSRILKIFFLHFHFSFSISSHFFHFSKKSESIFFTLHFSKKSERFYFSLFTSRTSQTHSRRGLPYGWKFSTKSWIWFHI